MATVYGYIRVSTAQQSRSGLSLAAQRRAIEAEAKRLRLPLGQVFRDAAVSASKRPMLGRPAGRELDRAAQRGDNIIVAKLDRAFRSLQDFALMLDRWQRRGVSVHLLDIQVDTSTPVGRMISQIVATVAEWESRRIGERIRDAHDERRRQGRKTNGTCAIGWTATRKKVRPHHGERRVARALLAIRRSGLTWQETAYRASRRGLRRRGGLTWHAHAAYRWAAAAALGFPRTGMWGPRATRPRVSIAASAATGHHQRQRATRRGPRR